MYIYFVGNFGNDRLEDKEWEERLKKEKKGRNNIYIYIYIYITCN